MILFEHEWQSFEEVNKFERIYIGIGEMKMKWLIASDVHGSAYYCEKLMGAYCKEQADRMLLLGDILYHLPRNDLPKGYEPKKVITLLNERKEDIICVRGNCDTEVDQMVLQFPIMADYALLTAGKRTIFATHGHVYHNDHLPPLHIGDILLHGHTHIPACEECKTHIYINPGSVSIPKENSAHSYMIFNGEAFEWKDLNGQVYKRFTL